MMEDDSGSVIGGPAGELDQDIKDETTALIRMYSKLVRDLAMVASTLSEQSRPGAKPLPKEEQKIFDTGIEELLRGVVRIKERTDHPGVSLSLIGDLDDKTYFATFILSATITPIEEVLNDDGSITPPEL